MTKGNVGLYKRQIQPESSLGVWICRVLLVVVVLAYSSLYFNNTYPISEGWGAFYAELIFDGKVPYRDFYYYLPPMSLFMDTVLWLLSFGSLLVFRAWRVLERIVIFVMVFNLLKRYFHYTYAFAACAFAVIICTGDVYDLLGDYNQTMALLSICLLYFAIGFTDAKKKKKKYHQLFLAGIILGLMFLNKQTIFLGSFLTYFVAITLRCIVKKDKKYLFYLLWVALGVLIPMGITALYLLVNGAFMPFIEQVFLNVDGKGSLFRIIVEGVSSRLKSVMGWSLIALIGAIFMTGAEHWNNELPRSGNFTSKLLLLLSVSFGTVFLSYYKSDAKSLWTILTQYKGLSVLILGATVICAALYLVENLKILAAKQPLLKTVRWGACFASSAAVLIAVARNEELCRKLYKNTGLFRLVQTDLQVVCMLGMLTVMLWYLFISDRGRRAERLFFLACAGFSLMYAGVMASGASAGPAHIVRIALPMVLCLLLAVQIPSKPASVIIKGGTWIVCVALCAVCVSQKVICSYSWWGSEMEPISEKTYTTNIPALAGITMSEERKELYETVTNLIEENSDEDAVVWGYPHNKLFNILTDRYNMNTFVPVLFYDVTADEYILKELEMLQENLPDIVVWQTLDNVLKVHEDVFRGGEPLKHRELEAFFAEVLPEKYTLIGTVSNVSVYKLNDEAEIKYTSYQKGVITWAPKTGVDKWENNAFWCDQVATWEVNSKLPAVQTVKLYVNASIGEALSKGSFTLKVNDEAVKVVTVNGRNDNLQVYIDVTLQPGKNVLQLETSIAPVAPDKYFQVKGLHLKIAE